MSGANAKVLKGTEAKPASIRTQLWPERPFAWPIAEHILSAGQDRTKMEATQSTCRCRR